MPMIELPTDIVPTGQQLLTYERTLPGAIMVNGGQALHQRGGQLQRVRRRLPRAGHDHGRVPQPAVLARLRPDLAREVRLRRRSRRNREGPHRLDHLRQHAAPSWRRSSASRPTRSRRRSSGSTPTRATSTIPTSTGAGARRTSGGATRRCATEPRGPRSGRSRRRPTTRSRCSAARSAPRAGRRPTRSARVLDVDGNVIPGLYAAGNAMASPLGMTYGGAGGTLGPAMVFGYLAGRDIAQRVAPTLRPAGAGRRSRRRLVPVETNTKADQRHGIRHDLRGEGRRGHRLPGDAPGLLHDAQPR